MGNSRQLWSTTEVARAVAPGMEQWRSVIDDGAAEVRRWLVTRLGARPGDTVLELAAGAGDTGFEVASIVGEDGRLICSDVSPDMVEVARRRGAELGRTNVEYRVEDAHEIRLEPQSVDGVVCRFGYMLMADPRVALVETRRVLRPGGRLALAVWGAAEHNPWMSVLAGLLVEGGHLPPPTPGAPGVFGLADVTRTRALLEEAGFSVEETTEVPARFAFADVDEYLRFVTDTSGPTALVMRGLSRDERTTLKSQLEPALVPFVEDGCALPGLALTAVAVASPEPR